jgi:hypothetical protein
MIISIRLRPFLSGQITSPFGFASPSLSASTPGVQDSGFPLLLSANGVSPPPFHLPVPVKMPVSNLDCEAILHPKKWKSSRKYFNYCPYFIEVLWKSCGKVRSRMWIKMWKILQVQMRHYLRNRAEKLAIRPTPQNDRKITKDSSKKDVDRAKKDQN